MYVCIGECLLIPAQLQGYLFKQGVGGVINTWKRRFFVLKEKKLLYYDGPRMKGYVARTQECECM